MLPAMCRGVMMKPLRACWALVMSSTGRQASQGSLVWWGDKGIQPLSGEDSKDSTCCHWSTRLPAMSLRQVLASFSRLFA